MPSERPARTRPPQQPVERLRVLIVNSHDDRLDHVVGFVERLGHDVVARSVDVEKVGPLSREAAADVALVGLGLDSDHALEMIDRIVHEAACPVIALLDAGDPAYVDEAAKHGIFAYVLLDRDPDELRSAIEITVRRFAEFRNLQGAFGRRAIVEQAKGVLMARHGLDAEAAFAMLRSHSQRTGEKLLDVAEAVTRAHALFPGATAGAEQDADR